MASKRKKRPDPVQVIEPTPEQLAKGGYDPESMPDPEGGNRVAQVHVNRGGTPIARWRAVGALSDSQNRAIDHCIKLWEKAGVKPSLTAQYGERIPSGGGCAELAAASQIDARDSLWRIIDRFPGPLRTYWGVFENICRHDMPAGVAGGALSQSTRTADARAFTVVCFVADIIAEKERL